MLASPWEYRPARDLGISPSATVQTGPFGAQLHARDYIDGGIPFILIKNIGDGVVDPNGMPSISDDDAARLAAYRLEPGDIVFSRVGRVGSCFLVEEKHRGWVISGQLLRLRPAAGTVDGRFLLHWLLSPFVQHFVFRASVGTTRQSINTQILGSIPIPKIPLHEQRRIGAILDTIDDAIRCSEQLVAKLERIEQGLVDDLLTRGIEENGALRDPKRHPGTFRGSALGPIPANWRIVTLAQVMQPGRKVTYGIVQPGAFTVGGVPLIRGQDYINGWQPLPTFFRVARPLHEQYTRSTTTVDDVLLTIVGATTGATAIVPAWLPEANITQTTARLAFDKQIVLPQFGRAFLDSDLGQRQVRRYTKGSAQPGLNLADVEVFRISVPPLAEQQTVMAIASSMAARIQREMRQLRKLRLVKRGLVKDLMTGGNRFTRLMANGAS